MRLVMVVLALMCLGGQVRADDCGDLGMVDRIEGAYAVLESADGKVWSQRMTDGQRKAWREGTRVKGSAECADRLRSQVRRTLERLQGGE